MTSVYLEQQDLNDTFTLWNIFTPHIPPPVYPVHISRVFSRASFIMYIRSKQKKGILLPFYTVW